MTESPIDAYNAANPPPPAPVPTLRDLVVRVLGFIAPWQLQSARESCADDVVEIIRMVKGNSS